MQAEWLKQIPIPEYYVKGIVDNWFSSVLLFEDILVNHELTMVGIIVLSQKKKKKCNCYQVCTIVDIDNESGKPEIKPMLRRNLWFMISDILGINTPHKAEHLQKQRCALCSRTKNQNTKLVCTNCSKPNFWWAS